MSDFGASPDGPGWPRLVVEDHPTFGGAPAAGRPTDGYRQAAAPDEGLPPPAVPPLAHPGDVTVYAFTILSAQGTSVASPYKAPLDVIRRQHGVAFEGTAEVVAAQDLDRDGFYRPPGDEWQSSSFDLQQGLDVRELDEDRDKFD